MVDHPDINRLLAQYYPHIKNPHKLLAHVDHILEVLIPFNGGTVEILTRYSGCAPVWNDGTIDDDGLTVKFRDVMRDDELRKK